MTLYFNNAVDLAWDTLGNWWQDLACTVPASALPASGDTVVIKSPSVLQSGPSVLIQPASVQFVENGGVGSADNDCDLSGFNCDIIFNHTSYNVTGIVKNGVFNGSTSNLVGGTVESGTFNDTSSNNGHTTTAVFNDGAQNTGSAETATFNDSSENHNPGATVTHGTFNDQSTNTGTVTNLLMSATFGSGRWTLARSPTAIGGTITNVLITNIGAVPAASDVRAGTSVGVSPAVGTLAVPSAANVRLGTAVDAGTGTAAIPAASSVRSGVAVDATTGTLVVPSAANVRLGTSVGVPPAAGTCAVPAASDVRLGVAVDATTGTLLTYTDPANPADMPDEHSIAFQEMLAEFGITYTFGGFSFLCVESDVSQSLEPILEGDFKNDSAPIIALKTAFNACPSGTPEIGDILVDPDGREFRVKSLRTSKDDVTIQFELTDIHDRG